MHETKTVLHEANLDTCSGRGRNGHQLVGDSQDFTGAYGQGVSEVRKLGRDHGAGLRRTDQIEAQEVLDPRLELQGVAGDLYDHVRL